MMEPANGKSDGKPTSIHHSHCHCRKAQQSLSLVLLRKLGKKGPQCSLCFRSMKLLQTDTLTYLKLAMAKHPTHRKASSKHSTTNTAQDHNKQRPCMAQRPKHKQQTQDKHLLRFAWRKSILHGVRVLYSWVLLLTSRQHIQRNVGRSWKSGKVLSTTQLISKRLLENNIT